MSGAAGMFSVQLVDETDSTTLVVEHDSDDARTPVRIDIQQGSIVLTNYTELRAFRDLLTEFLHRYAGDVMLDEPEPEPT